jgi:hypothetical protein
MFPHPTHATDYADPCTLGISVWNDLAIEDTAHHRVARDI